MQYSVAFAAVMATAFAGTTLPAPYGGPPVVTSAAPTTTAPAAGPKTSTAFVTDVETILSCGPSVTNCPGKSTSAPATSIPVVSTSQAPPAPPASSSTKVVVTTPVVQTTPVASSTPVSTKPATTAPATSQAPPAPPVPVLSTQAIETCVPTTIYKTVTVSSAAQTTPVATSKAPYATGSMTTKGVASGTGVGPKPSTTAPIQQGAASSLQISGGLALVAAAAILF